MGILFNNSKDIDIFASSIKATSYTDPDTGEKVFTSFYLNSKIDHAYSYVTSSLPLFMCGPSKESEE